jgi:hypothetical protein
VRAWPDRPSSGSAWHCAPAHRPDWRDQRLGDDRAAGWKAPTCSRPARMCACAWPGSMPTTLPPCACRAK